jgi:hypothetical protein
MNIDDNHTIEPLWVLSEALRFMRDEYVLDEVSDGKGELKFRRAGKTVLTLYPREECVDFLVIFGKEERARFEVLRDEFQPRTQRIYDDSKTFHDGKWMHILVSDGIMLEEVKRLIHIKKKPNRRTRPSTRLQSS